MNVWAFTPLEVTNVYKAIPGNSRVGPVPDGRREIFPSHSRQMSTSLTYLISSAFNIFEFETSRKKGKAGAPAEVLPT